MKFRKAMQFKTVPFLVTILFLIVPTISYAADTSSTSNSPINPFDDVCSSFSNGNGGVTNDAPSVCKENAQDANKSAKDLNPFSGSGGILLRTAKLLTFITGVASVIIIILSGLKYVVAGGDSNSINSAKNTLLYALVGLVVTLIAQGIIVFVVKALK